jgi:hypothetical protein
MGITAPRARAATRALAVLAVLLGLLAMHGLASTHHAAGATSAAQHHPAQAAADAAAVPAHQVAGAEAGPAAPTHGAASLAGPGGPTCDGGCPDLAVLCVAVLAGAALALLLARRRSVPLLTAPALRTARALTPAVWHPRGPDPVRELGVSRT